MRGLGRQLRCRAARESCASHSGDHRGDKQQDRRRQPSRDWRSPGRGRARPGPSRRRTAPRPRAADGRCPFASATRRRRREAGARAAWRAEARDRDRERRRHHDRERRVPAAFRNRQHVEEAEHAGGVGHARDDQPGAEDQAAEKAEEDAAWLASQRVARDRDDEHRDRHEGHGRGDRARREPRDAADAVARGAAAAEPRAESDQQARDAITMIQPGIGRGATA